MDEGHELTGVAPPRLLVDELIAGAGQLAQGRREVRHDEAHVVQSLPPLLQESGHRGVAGQRLDQLEARVRAGQKGDPHIFPGNHLA